MKNLYFFDDKGISTLVKAFVTNFISSKYYTSILDKISELVTRVDNITSTNSSNDIVIIQTSFTSNNATTHTDGSKTYTFHIKINYPEGFNEKNTILLGFTLRAWDSVNNKVFNLAIHPVYVKFDILGHIYGQYTLPYQQSNWSLGPPTICITKSE